MSTTDEQPKRRIPPLRKKAHTLADLDPESLAAALHYQELAAPGAALAAEEPTPKTESEES